MHLSRGSQACETGVLIVISRGFHAYEGVLKHVRRGFSLLSVGVLMLMRGF